MTNAIEVTNVTKVYRRYARRKQFATLKSAAAEGQPHSGSAAGGEFPALQGVSFNVPAGKTWHHRYNGSGKSTALKLVASIANRRPAR